MKNGISSQTFSFNRNRNFFGLKRNHTIVLHVLLNNCLANFEPKTQNVRWNTLCMSLFKVKFPDLSNVHRMMIFLCRMYMIRDRGQFANESICQ